MKELILTRSAQIINLYTDVKQSFAYKHAVKVGDPPTAQPLVPLASCIPLHLVSHVPHASHLPIAQ